VVESAADLVLGVAGDALGGLSAIERPFDALLVGNSPEPANKPLGYEVVAWARG